MGGTLGGHSVHALWLARVHGSGLAVGRREHSGVAVSASICQFVFMFKGFTGTGTSVEAAATRTRNSWEFISPPRTVSAAPGGARPM